MALELREKRVKTIGLNQEAVIEAFGCPNSEMADQVAALRGSAHADYPAAMTTPVCLEAEGVGDYYRHGSPEREGEARVVAVWQTLDWDQWMLHNHNKGIVFRGPAMTAKRPERDLDLKILNGDDVENLLTTTDVSSIYKWKVDAGEDINWHPKESFIIRAIVDDPVTYMTPVDGLKAHVNSNEMPHVVVDGEAGHLLYMGRRESRIFDNEDLRQVEFHFTHHDLRWNDQCLVRKYWEILLRQRAYYWVVGHENPVAAPHYWYDKVWKPSNITFNARLFAEGDFSCVDALCDWS